MHTNYMRALIALQRATAREIDRAQLAEAPDSQFAQALALVIAERNRLTHPEPR